MSIPPRFQTPPPIYEHSNNPGTTLKPYLTLPYLYSLTWLAYPILSLLFVAFRLQLSLASAEDAVSDAKDNLLTSCRAAEHAATAAASLPRFMAVGTNKQIVDAVNGTMNGAREALVLTLTVMEAIINFIVDTYRSTFLCFLELVVRGGLAILIGAVQELQSFIQSTLSGIRTSIQNDVASANSVISSAIGGINKVLPFGANINVPQFSIPSLDALNNVTLPTDFEDALTKLNASIPSLDDLRSKIDTLIDTPFELVKKDINDTFLGFNFNESLLPVPELNTLSFCGGLDTGVVDDLGQELVKVARIGVIILIILAVLLLAGNCLLEWYKWRSLCRSMERTRQAWVTDPTVYHVSVTAVTSTPSLQMTDHNLLTLHATSTHPLLSQLANKLSAIFHLSPSQYIHLQFFFHYVFHPPALACFLIGFFGLLSVELQLLAAGPVQEKFSQQVASSVADFSNTIATSMNASMQNQSAIYADNINGHVSTVQVGINDGLFGWVNSTTTTLNDTISAFYTDVQNAVTTVFGGTILDQPAQDFVRCIIGTKVTALENALTFLHDNLHVDLPVLNQGVLVLSPEQVNEATTPISEAAVGGGSNGNEGLVGRLINRYVDGLKKERLMFGVFIALWAIVVLMALCIIFWHSYGKVWVENQKRRKWAREQRGHVDTVARPWSPGGGYNNLASTQTANEKKDNLQSFAPLNSPEKSGFFASLRKSAAQGQCHRQRAMDGTASGSSSFTATGRKSNRLVSVGRRMTGREILLGDKDIEQNNVAPSNKTEVFEVEVREERGRPWWRRLLQRRGSDESFESEGDEKDLTTAPMHQQPQQQPQQRRPGFPNSQLTIETNIRLPPSQRQQLPIIVQDEDDPTTVPQKQPPSESRWSTSPNVPKNKPWARSPHSNTLPIRPKARPNVALPQSVDSAYGPSVMLSSLPLPQPPRQPANSYVPIHHGFIRPIPAETPMSPSPPASPVYEPTPTPLVPLIDIHHMQASTRNIVSDDPFATCFDDEYRVQPDLARAANPFGDNAALLDAPKAANLLADAGTPRAV